MGYALAHQFAGWGQLLVTKSSFGHHLHPTRSTILFGVPVRLDAGFMLEFYNAEDGDALFYPGAN